LWIKEVLLYKGGGIRTAPFSVKGIQWFMLNVIWNVSTVTAGAWLALRLIKYRLVLSKQRSSAEILSPNVYNDKQVL